MRRWSLLLVGCSPLPLDEAVERGALEAHLEALQGIADAHDGTRAAFTDGYDASADYVASVLEEVGYEVTRQPVTVAWPTVHDAALAVIAPEAEDFVWDGPQATGFSVWLGGRAANATAEVFPIDLVLPPGAEANTSTSGCEAADYADFPPGGIALVQRGTCTFSSKAALATEAGAAAMVLFNEGQEGRTERLEGATVVVGEPGVPIFSVSYDLGARLADTPDLVMSAFADVTFEDVVDDNILADTRRGDPERTVLVGAHLDSVPAGPGINDNGSGSALVLELAVQMARRRPEHRVRFAFWAAEELGLVGSRAYAEAYGTDEWAMFNYDMVGSPQGFPMVYDADGSFPNWYEPPAGTEQMEHAIAGWFEEQGLPWSETPALTASDSLPWVEAGRPVGGIYTGSSEGKWPDAVEQFGGQLGEELDPCYHDACDTLDSVDLDLVEQSARAAARGLEVVANTDHLGVR